MLFRDLVVGALGFAFLAHLEPAAGGLEKLAFRFTINDPGLYAAPFEAAVRVSGLPASGTPNDYSLEPFVLLRAPVTRRVKGGPEPRPATPREALPRPAKLLFVRSQVSENPAGQTNADTEGCDDRIACDVIITNACNLPARNMKLLVVDRKGLRRF